MTTITNIYLPLIIAAGFLYGCAIDLHEPAEEDFESSSFAEDSSDRYYYRTKSVVDRRGNVIYIDIQPGANRTEREDFGDGPKEIETFYPQGVSLECLGSEPFSYKNYPLNSYLTDRRAPRSLQVMLSFANVNELEIIGQQESALEKALEQSVLVYTISKIEKSTDGKVIVSPVQSHKIANPMAVNIDKMNFSTFSFDVQLNPVHLDERIYSQGEYAITDIWLTYLSGDRKYRKVSGGCPNYNFSVVGSTSPR